MWASHCLPNFLLLSRLAAVALIASNITCEPSFNQPDRILVSGKGGSLLTSIPVDVSFQFPETTPMTIPHRRMARQHVRGIQGKASRKRWIGMDNGEGAALNSTPT
jgi:hypothetical protein